MAHATLGRSRVTPMSLDTDGDDADDDHMTGRSDHHRRATPEERRFLEALVFWRSVYADRGPRDRDAVETVTSVIGDAERRMKALRLGALT